MAAKIAQAPRMVGASTGDGILARLMGWVGIVGGGFLLGLPVLLIVTLIGMRLMGGNGAGPVSTAPPTVASLAATAAPTRPPLAAVLPTPPTAKAVRPPIATDTVLTSCPATAKVAALVGLPVDQLGEFCGFAWLGGGSAETTCPSGFICTFAVAAPGGGGIVLVGDGQRRSIFAGTWRYRAAYPATDAVHDPCALLEQERAFARRFPIAPDGFACP